MQNSINISSLRRVKAKEFLFFIPYIIYMVFGILSYSFFYQYFVTFHHYINYACVGLLIVKEMIVGKYSLKSLLVFAVFAAFYAATVMFAGNVGQIALLYTFLFVYCGRDIEFEKIARLTIVVVSAILVFVVLSSIVGIVENYRFIQGDRIRYGLGFLYALFPSAFFRNIVMLTVYIKNKRIKWRELILLAGVNAVLFLLTDSRLNMLLVYAMILFAMYLKIQKKPLRFIGPLRLIMVLSYIICFAFTIYITVMFTNSGWMRELNEMLGGRLSMNKLSLGLHGLPLFGQSIKWIGSGLNVYGKVSTEAYMYVDNLYLQTMQTYGIVYGILMLVIYTLALFKANRIRNYMLLMMFSIMTIYGIVDDLIINLQYNTFMFELGTILLNSVSNAIKLSGKEHRVLKKKKQKDLR